MEKMILEEFKEDISLLTEAGFIAAKQLDGKSATKLFEAAQLLDPENINPQIGLGFVHLNKLEIKEANSIFNDVIRKDPENQLARIYLGVCYLFEDSKRKEGEELIRDAMSKTTDETIINLGKVALELPEKDLKKVKVS